jgi:hypothetical protein
MWRVDAEVLRVWDHVSTGKQEEALWLVALALRDRTRRGSDGVRRATSPVEWMGGRGGGLVREGTGVRVGTELTFYPHQM